MPIWYLLSAQSVGPTRKQSLAREGAVLSPLSSGNARALYRQVLASHLFHKNQGPGTDTNYFKYAF